MDSLGRAYKTWILPPLGDAFRSHSAFRPAHVVKVRIAHVRPAFETTARGRRYLAGLLTAGAAPARPF